MLILIIFLNDRKNSLDFLIKVMWNIFNQCTWFIFSFKLSNTVPKLNRIITRSTVQDPFVQNCSPRFCRSCLKLYVLRIYLSKDSSVLNVEKSVKSFIKQYFSHALKIKKSLIISLETWSKEVKKIFSFTTLTKRWFYIIVRFLDRSFLTLMFCLLELIKV